MGSQGSMYVIYGIVTKCKVEKGPKDDGYGDWYPSVLYSVNGHTVTNEIDDYPEAELETGVHFSGTSKINKSKLSIEPLGYNGDYQGLRHFENKALIGYTVCAEYYIAHASALPAMENILKLRPKLIAEIKEKLDIDVLPGALRLHLLFDSLNG